MLLFVGIQLSLPVVYQLLGIDNSRFALLSGAVVFVSSLIALAWPILRGVPAAQMFRDIGWQQSNVFVEGMAAGLAYAALIIAILFSLAFVWLLAIIMGQIQARDEFSSGSVGHPILEDLVGGDPWYWIGIFATACIAAPIVEETMFRGVLYRHLRDATGALGRFLSVFMSAAINSFIFAAIHPQGIVAVPALATLAVGFSLVREWRGSLLAPMLMHAVNNGLIFSMLFLLMS
jgi:membrane protease YdiL (CAAX protease family)